MNFGRYEVADAQESILGKGSMGIVYRAHDPGLNRQVAIKVPLEKLRYDEEAMQAFLEEAKLNASLSHPNILTIFDICEIPGAEYIAMELLEGKPLSKLMATMSQHEIISACMQVANGLDHAHRQIKDRHPVVHRDIKPANIMVLHDGQIKITDFGIAKGGWGDGHLETQTGVIKGTPAYMSPEQARGDSKHVDGRSDLFSLGVVLYEMTVGKRPFGGDGKDFMAVFAEILNKTPVEPCKADERIGRELSAVIMKALQKDPARRFQSGNELVQALKVCDNRETPAAQKSHKMATLAAGGAMILAAGGFFLFHPGKTETPAPPVPTALAPATPPPPAPVAPPGTTSQQAQGLHLSPPIVSGSQNAAPALRLAPAEGAPVTKEEAPKAAPKKVAERVKPFPKKTAERHKSAKKPASGPAPDSDAGSGEDPVAQASVAASSQYAFLQVGSSPAGAQVYVNGALKGVTPLKLRLNLGRYKVRLSRSGFQDAATSMTLDKMAEFPVMLELKPE